MRVLHGDMLTCALQYKTIPEIRNFIPGIRNKFCLDGTEVEKKNTKMFAPRKVLFEIRESL